MNSSPSGPACVLHGPGKLKRGSQGPAFHDTSGYRAAAAFAWGRILIISAAVSS
jgi:hypothetical protein